MNEPQLFEKIGRLQLALEEERGQLDSILQVFAEVISGQCDPQRVMVNLTDRTVTWAAEGERPATPATINGLPRVVVAPEPQSVGPFDDLAAGHEVTVTGSRLTVIRVEKSPPEKPADGEAHKTD